MKALGLDIGTSTISAVVYDTARGVLDSHTVKNNASLPGASWERLQDPAVIFHQATASVLHLLALHPDVQAIGLSGQMHGILYLDQSGEPASPLFTWQDGRGNLPFNEDCSWASHLSGITGHSLSSGHGMVTHYYNLNQNLIPENAVVLCTIQDYLAMKFSGRSRPVMDATNAASLGLYNASNHCFDIIALEQSGIGLAFLPELVQDSCLGTGPLGIPVYAALGDNQASFLGATGGRTDVLLINMGTGGQISVYSADFIQTDVLETRPFPDGGWLLVGASLCGGRSYAMLESFFRETVKMVTGTEHNAYEAMSRAMDHAGPISDYPTVTPLFQGTRKNPTLRGSIQNIGADNFTPLHFIYGMMYGMADELYAMYADYLTKGGRAPAAAIGSGNGLRRNPHLCSVFENTFGLELHLSENEEEAACGAAIYAANHCNK